MNLKTTNNPNQLTQIIDRIHDLEHNTGSVFTKDPDYSFEKFDPLLDIKANATPQQLMQFLSSDVRSMLQEYLRTREQSVVIDPTSLEQLSKHESHEVRERVASYPYTPSNILTELAFAENTTSAIQMAVIDNPNTPIEVIETLRNGDYGYISSYAQHKLKDLEFAQALREQDFPTQTEEFQSTSKLKLRKKATFEGGRFVIHEHEAKKAGLHYDLRLEWPEGSLKKYKEKRSEETPEPIETEKNAILKCWSVPESFPTESGNKKLAIPTEPHPYEYLTF